MAKHILLIEDEEKIARVLSLELRHEGYEVTYTESGTSGLELAMNGEWDLVLLDVMLPELSGLEVLRRIRQSDKSLPVLLLTARDSVPDKVSGLDLGANDYVTKPFAIEELLARIRNLLRQADQANERGSLYQAGDLLINVMNNQVTRGDDEIELTPREYDLLLFMVKHKGEVLTREQILSEVWGYDFMGDTNLVDVYIRYLRQKLEKGRSKLIHTLRGVGYLIRESEG